MCGIFGIVTRMEQPLGTILTEAGKRLSYRGYDSVGAATTHDDGTGDLRKEVGKVDAVAERYRFAEMTGRPYPSFSILFVSPFHWLGG